MTYIWAKNRHEIWRNERTYVIFCIFGNFQHLASIEHKLNTKRILIYVIAFAKINILYQYIFGIQMCSILAKLASRQKLQK